tara:strand:- start:2246 stop:2524 length:279 start_codon:yes stop_codon:yes gene_type:complete
MWSQHTRKSEEGGGRSESRDGLCEEEDDVLARYAKMEEGKRRVESERGERYLAHLDDRARSVQKFGQGKGERNSNARGYSSQADSPNIIVDG